MAAGELIQDIQTDVCPEVIRLQIRKCANVNPDLSYMALFSVKLDLINNLILNVCFQEITAFSKLKAGIVIIIQHIIYH